MIQPPDHFESGQGSPSVTTSFFEKVARRWDRSLFLCVGLDSSVNRLPASLQHLPPEEGLFEFNRQIIEATAEYAATFKPNVAFYEQSGPAGLIALKRTCDWLHQHYPELTILMDAKRGDLASTNEGYAAAFFDYYQADAITVQPYLGGGALAPFLDRADRGVFVLCRTSNPDSAEFQSLPLASDGGPLYLHVARTAAGPDWNRNSNVGLVAGATHPVELAQIRAAAPNLPLLIPGVGTQGGELGAVLANGLDAKGAGILVNASRSIIYASSGPDWVEAARQEAARLAEAMAAGQTEVMNSRQLSERKGKTGDSNYGNT